jgi:antagonist of KipI
MLEVLDPGLLSTVQDAGRPDWTHLGVPIGGACDRWSLAVANLLAGNEPGAAALEMTLVGPVLAVRETVVIGLVGADLGGIERTSGRRLEPGRTHRLEAGTTIAFPGNPSAGPSGARAYLALPGGLDVPAVLGSRSTSLAGAFGGLDGRPLRGGDVLAGATTAAARGGRRTRQDGSDALVDRSWPLLDGDPHLGDPQPPPIRLLRGPGDGVGVRELAGRVWRAAAGSDRVGIRLEGQPVDARGDGEMLSHGVVFGAVQVPPDGLPIVLLADHQTTGGYPVVAVVISADHPRLGQLRPGATASFVEVSPEDAVTALAHQRAALALGARMLREAAGWDELWRSAGG